MPIKATVSNTAPLSRQQSSKWILDSKFIHRAWMNCTVHLKQSKKGENVKSCVLPPNLSRVQWISHNSELCPCLQALRKRRQDMVEVKTWLGYAGSQWQMQSDWQADMTSTQKFHTASVKRWLWSYQQGYEECKHVDNADVSCWVALLDAVLPAQQHVGTSTLIMGVHVRRLLKVETFSKP